MSNEIAQIQETIKNLLKSSGIHYEELAGQLGISHASVKRILNAKDMPLSKLAEIAKVIGLDFFELIEQSKKTIHQRFKFTHSQELLLSKEFSHFLLFRLLLLKQSKTEIMLGLALSEETYYKKLKAFEEVGLLEILSDEKIKLKATFPFQWNDNGPLEKVYTKRIVERLTKELYDVGINKSKDHSTHSQVNIKELLLHDSEFFLLKNELQELMEKYEVLSKMRMKSRGNFKVVSLASLVGIFSLWE